MSAFGRLFARLCPPNEIGAFTHFVHSFCTHILCTHFVHTFRAQILLYKKLGQKDGHKDKWLLYIGLHSLTNCCITKKYLLLSLIIFLLVYTDTDTVSVRVPYLHSVSTAHTQTSCFRSTNTLRDTQNHPFLQYFL